MISMAEGSSWLRTRIRGEVGVDDLDLDPDLEGQEDHDPRDPGLGQGPREETKIPNPDQGPNLGIGQGPKERDPSQGPDPSQETKVALSLDPDQDPRKDQSQDQDLRILSPDQDPALTGEIKDPGQGVLSKKIRKQEEDLQFRRMEIDQDQDPNLKKGLTMVLMIDMQAFKKKTTFFTFC